MMYKPFENCTDSELLEKLRKNAIRQVRKNMRSTAQGQDFGAITAYTNLLEEIKTRLTHNGAGAHPELYPIAKIMAALPAWRGEQHAASDIANHLDEGRPEWVVIVEKSPTIKVASQRISRLTPKK